MEDLAQSGTLGALVRREYHECIRRAKFYRGLYYGTRSIAGLSSVMLPFTLPWSQPVSTGLAIAVALATAVDLIWTPKDNWEGNVTVEISALVSAAKQLGVYEQNKELLELIANSKRVSLKRLVEVKELLEQVN